MVLIAAMMTVTVVAVKFVGIAARCAEIVANGKTTIIGCKTNCFLQPALCCMAAGCSPIYGGGDGDGDSGVNFYDFISSGEYHFYRKEAKN